MTVFFRVYPYQQNYLYFSARLRDQVKETLHVGSVNPAWAQENLEVISLSPPLGGDARLHPERAQGRGGYPRRPVDRCWTPGVTKRLVDQLGGVRSVASRMADPDACRDLPLSWYRKLVCPFCAAAGQRAQVGDGRHLDSPPLFQSSTAIGTLRCFPDHVQ